LGLWYDAAMRDVETVTARGTGRWDEEFSFELVTRSVVRLDRGWVAVAKDFYGEVRVADQRVGTRRFASEGERDAFLAEQFTDVVLTPVKPFEERECPHVMAGWVGVEVSSLTFVADYVQVRFNRPGTASFPTLTLYVWPFLALGDRTLRRSDPTYLDAMVGLIGNSVRAVDELLDRGLVLDLTEGWRLIEPLDGTGLQGAVEVAEYSDADRGGMIWRPGDEPIGWIGPARP
jgi:hypothetical protein